MQYLNDTPVASIIFLFTIITSIYAFNDNTLYGKFMLHPYSVANGKKYYTFITSGLIHADWMHLFFNMFTFIAFAFKLETLIGHWQFGLLYFVSMVLADIPSVIKHKENFRHNSLGASGAISAVLFSFILFYPLSKLMIFPIPFGIPAIAFGVLYLVYCYFMSKQSRDNINHDAHLFGALAGIVITIILQQGIIAHFLNQLGIGG
ncbi:rhomboid family intramembrane serine protease [Pedobacter boryungensis]|uniref:Rhomboid family intramembrane serine protease n=1 Tax=Pedobacter boryungensis TaxID=869962 RepID=A0ABX2DFC9_9SPHI|nr:rhomboid family intramembrane serine protease [Pedobacter boryungensis]NQX31676.1 rhomboid family intramembrane serine protease [Pedobacter boryungensis]